jgi:DNA-binding beta-propeller fold protein YncE
MMSASSTAHRPRPRALLLVVVLAFVALGALPSAASAAFFEPEASFGQLENPQGVATDDAGRVYVADAARGRVDVFDSARQNNRFLRSIGEGDLKSPVGVAVDVRGRIYVADAAGNTVTQYDSILDDAKKRRFFGSPGSSLGNLSNPRYVDTDGSAQVYVTERDNLRLQYFKVQSGDLVPVAAFGLGDGFDAPEGLVRDKDGRLYVADDSETGGEVRVLDDKGAQLRTVAGAGTAEGQVASPRGLADDRLGRLFVVDSGNSRVQAFGSFASGSNLLASSGSLGTGSENFDHPSGAAVAPGALLYVADSGNHRVVRLRIDDQDHDGALDAADTCPGLADADQRDTDRDGMGDACDPDDDGDRVLDEADRCPRGGRGTDANDDGCADPTSSITSPRSGTYSRARAPRTVSGRAAADELGVLQVDVALARKRGSRCSFFSRGRFGAPRACASPVFIRASGRERFSARVSLRAPGTYVVRTRALQRGGLAETRVDAKNQRTLRVR